MALHFRPPLFQKQLVWHMSDWNGPEGLDPLHGPLERETRAALRYRLQESKDKMDGLLFSDQNGEPIFKGTLVELTGLKSVQFNGRRGLVIGRDPKSNERIAVQLSKDNTDQKSFRQDNIMYIGCFCPEDAVLRAMTQPGWTGESQEEFFSGLLDRTREINILKKETWSNVQDLEAKCALVTCSSLLTCLGYRDPTAWQDTMEFASKFLAKHGILLQFDAIGHAGFGNERIMESYISEKSLRLELVDNIQDGYQRSDGQVLKGFVWKKV